MLTRLQIDGFKNLRAVDLRFGPFTCIAGRNGVGKSNLFDVITFLSDLSSMPLVEAAVKVRGTGGRIAGIGQLFGQPSEGLRRMTLIADMLVPRQVVDDYDRAAQASATYLQYTLVLVFEPSGTSTQGEPFYIEKEELVARSFSAATEQLGFGPTKSWLRSHVVGPRKRTAPFISTEASGGIKLWGDRGQGRPGAVPARKSPQTVLSGVNASTHPTALAARREMQSWRQLQLEPSALRSPDEYRSASRLSATGGHLPNALARIGCNGEIAQLLSDLIPGIVSVEVDSDDVRQLRTLKVTMRDRQSYAASSLSDGTLRFLALGALASDPMASGLVCLEEPENGIHPQRIPEMLNLVTRLSNEIDSDESTESDDPDCAPQLRQVIINTHSPLVVAELLEADLLMAETLREDGRDWVGFKPLHDTWRAKGIKVADLVTKGELQSYLAGIGSNLRTVTRPGSVMAHMQRNLFTGT